MNCDSMPLGPDNPHGVGFVATETEFASEQEAIREVDPRRSRVWKVKNEHSRNANTGARLWSCKYLHATHFLLLRGRAWPQTVLDRCYGGSVSRRAPSESPG